MPSITQNNGIITFTNDDAIYRVKAPEVSSGIVQSVYLAALKNNGQTVWKSDQKSTFAILRINTPTGPQSINSIGLDYTPINGLTDEGILKVRFPYPAEMAIRCKAEPDHFLFELRSIVSTGTVSGPVPAIAAVMVQIILEGQTYGGFLPALNKENYLVSQIPLHEETHVHSTSMSNDANRYAMLTASFEAINLESAKMALVVCPKNQWLDRIQALQTQYDLPRPEINGVWDKKHPDTHSSYLFVDLTLKNHQELIQYAKKGGFKHVMPYQWIWSETSGTYAISEAHYEGQQNKLMQVANALQAHGLKLGLHVKAFMVGKTDQLVRPIPDPRLSKKRTSLVLAEDIGTTISPIQTITVIDTDAPDQFDRFLGAVHAGQKDILIDNEIMVVESVSSNGEIIVSRRGANSTDGSTITDHNEGAIIYHLTEFFNNYLADPDTDLPGQIAQNVADVYNGVGASFAFLDGAEGARILLPVAPWSDNWYWYTTAQVAEVYRRYLDQHVLLESSGVAENIGYPWFQYARGGSGDYATYAVEAFMDHNRIGRYRDQVYQEATFPQELGWMALLARVDHRRHLNASYPATTIDEMEYQMNRALGFGLPISLESNLEEMRENGSTNEIIKIIGQYEKIRQNYRVPSALKPKLQGLDSDLGNVPDLLKEQYHLQSIQFISIWGLGFALCQFRRQVYVEKILSPNESWEFENPFYEQPLQIKITALPSYEEFNHPENIVLIDSLDASFEKHSFGSVVGQDYVDWKIENGYIRVSVEAASQTQYETFLPRFKWCSFRKVFDSFLDLSEHKVIEVEVEGDNKGEAIYIQLEDNRGFQRVFQVVVNFNGNLHFHFDVPTEAAFYDYQPFNNLGRVNRWFNWSQITALEIYVKHIPQEGIDINIYSMKAIKQAFPFLKNPEIELGKKTIRFPALLNPFDCTLGSEPWDFLMYDGNTFNRFNGNNQLIDNGIHHPIITPPPAIPPKVQHGVNTLVFKHPGENKARIRILLEGQGQFWWFPSQ